MVIEYFSVVLTRTNSFQLNLKVWNISFSTYFEYFSGTPSDPPVLTCRALLSKGVLHLGPKGKHFNEKEYEYRLSIRIIQLTEESQKFLANQGSQ